jgi:hypothetical protein
MPAPSSVIGTSGLPVWVVDGAGNTTQSGSETVEGGIVLAPSAAPPAAPGSVSLYNNNGILTISGTLALPGNITLGTVTITGNLGVGGNITVTGTTTNTGLATFNGGISVPGGTADIVGEIVAHTQLTYLNAGTPSTPSSAAKTWAAGGQLMELNPQGLVQTVSSTIAVTTAPTTVANTAAITALQAFTVPAGDPAAGAVYQVTGWGVYSDTLTPTLTFTLDWGGVAGTVLAATAAVALPASITNSPFSYVATVVFSSATSAVARIQLTVDQSIVTGAANTYIATPAAAVTVSTSGANALVMAVTWSAASASNTITLTGGMIQRLA